MKKLIYSVAALAFMATTPVAAATYVFTLSSSLGSGSGNLTTVGDASQGFSEITSLSGVFAGGSISLLAPGLYPTGFANDNLFTATAPFFNSNGLSFSANGSNYNLYRNGSNVQLCGVTAECTLASSTTFSATLAPAVPEPGTWAMMLLGFGMVGFGLRSRRGKVTIKVNYA